MLHRWSKREDWPEPTAEEIAFFGRLVRPGELVFDVGANIGNKSAIFRRLGARVVAFEPQPACVEALRRRFRRDSGIEVVASGVAAEPGELEMSVCTTATTISTFSEEWKHGRFEDEFQWDATVTVPVTTLDEAIARWGSPAFTKVDVEGYELQVLDGLSSPSGTVSFEFAQEFVDLAVDCVRRLSAVGYAGFNLALGETPAFDLPDWVDADTMAGRVRALEYPSWGDVYASIAPEGPPS